MSNMNHGSLVISLDFELYWGVRDKRSLQSYRNHLAGVWQAIPRTLEIFRQFDIHATWATVGLLFCKDAAEAGLYRPAITPEYELENLSPYDYLDHAELEPCAHFAPELIDLIASYPFQEIATHTFSHFYCREQGQTLEAFTADIDAAIAVSQDKGLATRSIVFPRNQWNPAYLFALKERGIRSFRGNETSWCYRPIDSRKESTLMRAGRFLDTYANLCGHQTYAPESAKPDRPINLPASRLLRPFTPRLAMLEPLRLRRIKRSLRHAAKNHQVFHLWWHPHNFGINTDVNISFLAKVLQEFSALRDEYGMRSLTMDEVCDLNRPVS